MTHLQGFIGNIKSFVAWNRARSNANVQTKLTINETRSRTYI